MIKELLSIPLVFSVISTATADTKIPTDPVQCMATNLYFEARDQSFAGQIAIALVVVNRVKDKRFPNSICSVIYEGPMKESWKTKADPTLSEDDRIYYPIKNRCQFSWYCDGKSDEVKEESTYKHLYEISELFLDQDVTFLDITEGSTHYHAHYVAPDWGDDHTKVMQIDDHIFYRWETPK